MDEIIHNSYPLITIVIPIYKVEKYLRFCLDSVINQTYTNLQILLINDGSPDQCEKICLEYCKKDLRFDYYYKENSGVGETRNYALKYLIKGEYVSFLDSDDAVHPQQFEILYHLLEKHPECSFSQTMYKRFSSEDTILFRRITEVKSRVYTNKTIINRMLLFDSDSSKMTMLAKVSWGKLYRINDIKECKFHSQTPAEDVYFNSLLYPRISYFVETYEVLYYYRYNPSSITSSPSLNYCINDAERFGDLYEHLNYDFFDIKNKVIQCTVRKFLGARFRIQKHDSEEHKKRIYELGMKFFPLYLKCNDSLKMKLILGTFYYLPFTYRWFRALMEWKAKK